MDPISALGIAAAVVQFVQVSLHVLKTCREIRDSAEASTEHNRDLEEATKAALQFRKDVGSSSFSASSRSTITQIAKKCEDDANELIKLLELVRDTKGQQSGKQANKAKAMYNALRDSRKIKQIEARLKDHEQQLNGFLVQTMQTDVKAIRKQLDQMDAPNKKDMATLTQYISDLRLDIKSSEVNVKKEINTVDQRAQSRHDQERKEAQHRRLLESLFFPDIDQRRQGIKDALPETTNWIFDMESDDDQPRWANFETWLREDSSVYWISGKAAAGKSTLMAKIVEDEQTEKVLEEWSHGKKLCILSFYFWRPGSELQRSTIGLLRSLLYQMYENFPRLAETGSASEMPIATWTERRLTAAIRSAFMAAQDIRACLFIDGLDEYDGDDDEILDLIFDLDRLANVKLCVSSRPETSLRVRLKNCKCLRLEDYNRAPIHTFVSARLTDVDIPRRSSHPVSERSFKDDLIDEVVDGANGIFLWAALVVQALIRGVKSGDDDDMLYQRLHDTPKELNALFAQMLDQVENPHKQKLAFFFQVMKLTRNIRPYLRNVCFLTAAWNAQEMEDYESFAVLCNQTKEQILAQSAGLLEVHYVNDHTFRESMAETSWHHSPSKFMVPALMRSGNDRSGDRKRARVNSTTTYPSLLAYEREAPMWIHRSAFDYIFPPDNGLSALGQAFAKGDEITSQILDGMLRYFAVAPSSEHEEKTSTWRRQKHLIYVASFEGSIEGEAMTKFLHSLASLTVKMDPDELLGSSFRRLCYDYGVMYKEEMILFDFWSQANLLSFVQDPLLSAGIVPRNAEIDVLVVCLLHLATQWSSPRFPPLSVRCIHALTQAIREYFASWQARPTTPQAAREIYIDHPSLWVSRSSEKCAPRPLDMKFERNLFIGLAHAAWYLVVRSPARRENDNQAYCTSRSTLYSAIYHDLRTILIDLEVELALIRDYTLGISSNHAHYKYSRLAIQASPDLWLALRGDEFSRHHWHSPRLPNSVPHQSAAMVGTLRFVCHPGGVPNKPHFQNHDAIFYMLREETTKAILSTHVPVPRSYHERQLHVRRENLDILQEMVIQELWMNERGLSATDQLFVIACVRAEFRDFFHVVDDDE